MKWRGGPGSGEGYPWNKKPKVDTETADKASNDANVNPEAPKESIEQKAARRLKEAQALSEATGAKKQALQAGSEDAYAELLKKVDAKVERDVDAAEKANRRFKDL